MSNGADLAAFSFQWFDNTPAPITGVVSANATSPNLINGAYYVQVTNALGCTSDLTLANINDLTAPPVIHLSDYLNPAICVLPEVTGRLTVFADDGSNPANYTFDWYTGSVNPPNFITSNSQLSGITSSNSYAVRVTNITTNCFADATYKLKTDTVTIHTLASAVPVTNCSLPLNSALYATTIEGNGNFYTYEWYKDGVRVSLQKEVPNAGLGLYTAIAKHTDPTYVFCTIVSDTATVLERKIYPSVSATPVAPLTYCDPAKQNGAAMADVGGDIINYIFEWYEDPRNDNAPFYTGSHANGLGAKTYWVKAMDRLSFCPDSVQITIESDPTIVPVPEIQLLSNYTDCTVANGALAASVDGITYNHIFNWYDGEIVKNAPDAEGEFYADLDDQIYTVTATDRETGCISLPVSKPVEKILALPEFKIEALPENCQQENGYAKVIIADDSDIETIEWNINGTIFTGTDISNLLAGKYKVTAITSLNCTATNDFEIKSEINIYNAVSPDNNGAHDYFEIACIENFQNNTVKIFNRAGTLVFENKGYNNSDIMFNGISNKGISVMGSELPEGTYFYIIDKGDGSRPLTGYLELLR